MTIKTDRRREKTFVQLSAINKNFACPRWFCLGSFAVLFFFFFCVSCCLVAHSLAANQPNFRLGQEQQMICWSLRVLFSSLFWTNSCCHWVSGRLLSLLVKMTKLWARKIRDQRGELKKCVRPWKINTRIGGKIIQKGLKCPWNLSKIFSGVLYFWCFF